MTASPTQEHVTGLRERTRRAVCDDITATAVPLFVARGFDAVTTQEIARAAGISPRSFFRYFPTKEDVLLGGVRDAGRAVEAALAARPLDEPAWDALRNALPVLVQTPAGAGADALALSRLLVGTPSLRAREQEKQQQWTTLLLPHVSARLGRRAPDASGPDPRAAALIGCALACLHAATLAWVRDAGRTDPLEVLDEAMRAVSG